MLALWYRSGFFGKLVNQAFNSVSVKRIEKAFIIQGGIFMFCKNCGQTMNDNQAICLNCGVKVGTGNKFCANCGKDIAPDASVCLNCGVAVKNASGDLAGKDKVTVALVCWARTKRVLQELLHHYVADLVHFLP